MVIKLNLPSKWWQGLDTRHRPSEAEVGVGCKKLNREDIAIEVLICESSSVLAIIDIAVVGDYAIDAWCGYLRAVWQCVFPKIVKVFSQCRKLVGHILVCGRLYVAAGVMKHRATKVTKRRDDELDELPLDRWC